MIQLNVFCARYYAWNFSYGHHGKYIRNATWL